MHIVIQQLQYKLCLKGYFENLLLVTSSPTKASLADLQFYTKRLDFSRLTLATYGNLFLASYNLTMHDKLHDSAS